MGLIGDFFGLLFSGGYTAKTLISDKANDREYEARAQASKQMNDDLYAMLQSYELEKVVKGFVSNPTNNAKIKELLNDELAYISGGDSKVIDWMFGSTFTQFTSQQKVDLIMSKFGKLSSTRMMYRGTRLGNLDKIGAIDSYEQSIRVLQCIESNLYKSTSRMVLFGVQEGENCCLGKYCSAPIVLSGTTINRTTRIYEFIDIPYTPIKLEDLKNV